MSQIEKDKENGWESVEVSLDDLIKCIDDDDFEGLNSLLFFTT